MTAIDTHSGRAPVEDKEMPGVFKKVVAGAMAGTVAEWYEFFIYGTAATLVFGTYFFHQTGNPLDGILAAFLTYAVGFIARPLGGMVFGHFGDRIGRKKALQASLLLVGTSTFLMGCLPGFEIWGYGAPIALVVLRFVQGFAVGGEWGGAVLLIGEHAPAGRRGYWSSFPQAAACVGNVLATIVLLSLSFLLPEEAFLSWGWRVAFWLSAFIIIIGWYVRRKVEDAPIFVESLRKQEEAKVSAASLGTVLKRHPKEILIGMGARLGENTVYYAIIVFSITYLKLYVGLDSSTTLLLMFIANVIQFFAMIFAGWLSDVIGRRPTYLIGAVLLLVWIPCYFPMLNTGSFGIILIGISLGLSFQALCYGPQGAMLGELFPTRMRYQGTSFTYQVTSILAGSLAPVICTAILNASGAPAGSPLYPIGIVIYLGVLMLISAFAVWCAKETRGKEFSEIDEKDVELTDAIRVARAAQ